MAAQSTTIPIEEDDDKDRTMWPTILDYITFFTLIILYIILFCVTMFVTPTEQPIKSSECHQLSHPMVEEGTFNWNIFLLVISSIIFLATMLWIEVASKTKAEYDNSLSPLGKSCIAFGRLNVTLGIGLIISVLVVVISSYAEGYLAPNFIAACGILEEDLRNICNPLSFTTTHVKCRTRSKVWISARSSSPSQSATIQAFLMVSLALYAHYRMKEPAARRYLKFVLQLLALILILASGYSVFKRNEANWIAIFLGYIIGIIVAVLTITFARKWLAWAIKNDTTIPYYWKDEDITFARKDTLPPPPPPPVDSTRLDTDEFEQSIKPVKEADYVNDDHNPLIQY